ncbi:MAG: secretin N-terminal domain-containing protein, partial [Planctomycetota bacterium]
NAAQARPTGRRGPRGRPQDDDDVVRVTADTGSNSLLLTGRGDQIAETITLIKQLDQTSATLASETRIFPLKQARASELAVVLERILIGQSAGRRGRRGRRGGPAAPQESDIRIAAQDEANAIVIQAPPEAIALAEQIIKDFDSGIVDGTSIQIVKLVNAEAFGLAEAVNQALARQRPAGRRGRAAPTEGAVVVPEGHSNSVLVRGPKADVAKAVELIRQLDAEGPGVGTQVRLFPLTNADATVVAKTFDTLFRQISRNQQRRGKGRQAGPAPTAPSLAADERTNTLIVSASQGDFVTIEALVKKMDVEAEPLRPVQYVPLFYADALDVQTKIEGMCAERKAGDRPTVTADELSNGLTVIAREADFRQIEQVVAEWERTAEPNYVSVRVIPLSRNFQADQLAGALKRVFEQVSTADVQITDRLPKPAKGAEELFQPAPVRPGEAAATRPATAPTSRPAVAAADDEPIEDPPVMIAVDKEANALIISAGRQEMYEIEELIFTLTSSEAAGDAEPRVFPVKNADPASLAKTLNALFNPRQARPPAQPRSRQRGGRQQQPQRPPATPKPKVTIAADVRTRKIVALAKPAELDAIGDLIEQLDTVPEVTSDVRIFVLKNTDAAEVANNLRQLFSPTTVSVPAAGGRGRGGSRNQQLVQQMLQLRQQGAAGKTVDPSVGVMVSANRMTNSVIVAAPKDAMELIFTLTSSEAAGDAEPRVFPVKN